VRQSTDLRHDEVSDCVDGGNDVIGPVAIVKQKPADEQGEQRVGDDESEASGQLKRHRRQQTADQVADGGRHRKYYRCVKVVHSYHGHLNSFAFGLARSQQGVVSSPENNLHIAYFPI